VAARRVVDLLQRVQELVADEPDRAHPEGLGALGLAGSALARPALAPAAGSDDPPGHWVPASRLLLKGGIVLRLDGALGDGRRGDVLIESGKIKEVASHVPPHGAAVVDCADFVVMPGFVDTHRHMWQGLLRNLGPDELLADYLDRTLFGFAPRLTPEEVYLGDLVTASAALNSGVTCLLDWSHIATSKEHTDAAIQGLHDAGIRAVYAYGPNFGLTPAWHERPDDPYPGDLRRLRSRYFSSPEQLLTLALAAAGPEFAPLDKVAHEWAVARAAGARISVHVGVGEGGRQGKLLQLHRQVPGGLRSDTTYIHACTLGDAEWDLIRDTGGTVSLAFPVEMQMGHGMPPVQQALARGIRPSLSVDVETNQPTDMFNQMRFCFALQRGLANEPHLFRLPDGRLEAHRRRLLTARDVLQCATVEGARANGLEQRIGTLTPWRPTRPTRPVSSRSSGRSRAVGAAACPRH
jgi:cytosine/adenosine deaminase-related metal-dependent hydrolase